MKSFITKLLLKWNLKKVLIVIGTIFLVISGVISYRLFGPELPVALNRMDRLHSVTASFSGGTIYIDGDNAKYNLYGMDPFYCHFGGSTAHCYDENGRLISTINNTSALAKSGIGFDKFTDFLSYDCQFEDNQYVCFSAGGTTGPALVHIIIVDRYVKTFEFKARNYNGVYNWIKFSFSRYNNTNVDMPHTVMITE
ncbi:MAG: hypothetical protein V1920_05115 [Bacillota bacterium]